MRARAAGAATSTGTAVLLALAATSLFGTVGTARVLAPHVSGWSLAAARLLIGTAGLVALAVAAGGTRATMGRAARSPWTWAAGAAMASFQVTFLSAVRNGVAVATLVAIGSTPLFTGLLERRRVSVAWAGATTLALSGLTLLVLGGSAASSGEPVALSVPGAALALGAGLSYAAYTVTSKAAVDSGHRPGDTAAASFAVAAALLAPALVLVPLAPLLTARGLATVLYLALVTTTLTYAMFTRALQHLPAPTVSTLALAEPLVATALGVLVLDERLAPLGVLGAVLVLAGLVLAGRAALRRTGESIP
ncbi:MAG: EamA family transporter [Actinomycetota bacterium]|nr:EamA family transporter [Actinomycetota bacterium]